ncbi:MAG TPA: ABC transporter ATP-binding protein [Phycisphaerae bacterium]|nr:ABC transporter ATP-binding protein [Phycisphaerae bacterium]
MSTPEPVMRVTNLIKQFKQKAVLRGLNLEVSRGSVLGLLGKNGAGKTTLIECALGLLRPDSGETWLLGEPAWTLSAAAKARLGYVPQEISLYPWMKTGQLLEYTASFYPRWNDALVKQFLRDWELDGDAKIGKMSVGTRQKLAIILALAHEPELVVLDEPAASLDPAARREFLKTVLAVTAEGNRTVLFSTHITSDLERVADHVAILSMGKIVFHGELDALKDSVKRLHIAAPSPLEKTFTVPGAVHVRVDGTEALVSVRDASPQVLETIRQQYSASVKVEDLNLEDIFLEMQYEAPQ